MGGDFGEELDPTFERRRNPQTPSAEVIQIQLGMVQNAIAQLDRTVDRGLENVGRRLDRTEERMTLFEVQAGKQDARLIALEQARQDQAQRDEHERVRNVDNSEMARTIRTIAWFAGGILTAVGTLVAILAALGALS